MKRARVKFQNTTVALRALRLADAVAIIEGAFRSAAKRKLDDLCAVDGIRRAGFKTDYDFESEQQIVASNIKKGVLPQPPKKPPRRAAMPPPSSGR